MSIYMPAELELIERLRWFIRLRWIAVIGVLAAVWFSNTVLRISLPALPLCIIATFIAIYNLVLGLYMRAVEVEKVPIDWVTHTAGKFANLQICLDWFALILIIHFSGGLENPFIFYFIFHMIIASILLSRKASYTQAGLATFLLGALGGLEYFHTVPHIPLRGLITSNLYDQTKYVLSTFFVFATTTFISVYLTTTITTRLRERERELVILQQEMEEANKLLKEQDRLKSEYVLMVSHNIRAPLATIQTILKVVLQGIGGEVSNKARDFLHRAESRAYELSHLVKDLLDLSRIRATKTLRLEPIQLLAIIQHASDDMRIHAEDKDIDLKLDIPVTLALIKGDKDHIEQVFINLLTNAVKYTSPGGLVSVKAAEENDRVKVEVSDTGIGIPADDLPKIFDEFYRAKNAKHFEPDGTGLGLSLVKYIIERHGGKIWAESREGKGTKFIFTLPKSQP